MWPATIPLLFFHSGRRSRPRPGLLLLLHDGTAAELGGCEPSGDANLTGIKGKSNQSPTQHRDESQVSVWR